MRRLRRQVLGELEEARFHDLDGDADVQHQPVTQAQETKTQTAATAADLPTRPRRRAPQPEPDSTTVISTARSPAQPPRRTLARPQEEPEQETEPEPEPVTEILPYRPIRGLQRLRRRRKPVWRRRFGLGVLLTTLLLVLLCWYKLAFTPDTVQLVPSGCTAAGAVSTDTSGIHAQLALCKGRYSVVAQQADGVTMQQSLTTWMLQSLSPKKAVYETRAVMHFPDQTVVVVGLERVGKRGTPHIIWERVS